MPDKWTEIGTDLAEFEAWANGEGRGPNAGKHWTVLKHLESFYKFKQKKHERINVNQQRQGVDL